MHAWARTAPYLRGATATRHFTAPMRILRVRSSMRQPPPPPPPPNKGRQPLPQWVKRAAVAVPVLGGAFYASNLEEAPYTGRRRFIIVSEPRMRKYGEMTFLQLQQEYKGRILPESHAAARTVRRVGKRIAAASGDIGRTFEWEFIVIRDDQINAFVLPGGKVCVFTGLFRVTPNEDAVAAVLGHEAAHALANHAGEKMSKAWVVELLAMVVYFVFGFQFDWITRAVSRLVLELPNSRLLESEADEIGLILMAAACYNPQEMPKVFARMAKANKGKEVLEYVSTHPSDESRIKKQLQWMPAAVQAFDEHCSPEVREGLWARAPGLVGPSL